MSRTIQLPPLLGKVGRWFKAEKRAYLVVAEDRIVVANSCALTVLDCQVPDGVQTLPEVAVGPAEEVVAAVAAAKGAPVQLHAEEAEIRTPTSTTRVSCSQPREALLEVVAVHTASEEVDNAKYVSVDLDRLLAVVRTAIDAGADSIRLSTDPGNIRLLFKCDQVGEPFTRLAGVLLGREV